MFRRNGLALALTLVTALLIAGCQPIALPTPAAEDAPQEGAVSVEEDNLVIYSGRNENLVGPLLEQFQADTGITVEVRYGDTAEMAATILEEGQNSPADVFFGQDAGALGALEQAGRFQSLPEDVLELVDPRFRSDEGQWIGVSGRARVFAYNSENVGEDELPVSIWDLTDPAWQGRVGWAPTNGSFQSFVTALRVLEGEERAREWLEAMIANDVQIYSGNTQIVEAVGRGEIDLGLTNHYYLYRFLAEDPNFPVVNYYPPSGGAESMVNVAGVGILDTANSPVSALSFVRYLLSDTAEQYFADQTVEYPLAGEVTINERLTPLSEINIPDIDLSDLADLEGTLQLLQDVGALD
ncbi:extracellular solute-binding protein [bacterium]|nr:extracellular solute-binding protein [bacterium]